MDTPDVFSIVWLQPGTDLSYSLSNSFRELEPGELKMFIEHRLVPQSKRESNVQVSSHPCESRLRWFGEWRRLRDLTTTRCAPTVSFCGPAMSSLGRRSKPQPPKNERLTCLMPERGICSFSVVHQGPQVLTHSHLPFADVPEQQKGQTPAWVLVPSTTVGQTRPSL